MSRGIAVAALAVACNPPPSSLYGEPDAGPCQAVSDPAFRGGKLAPPDCDYVVRTGCGATAPELPGEPALIGADPTPFQIHLGLADDPRTSMVVTWRTPDDETTAGELEVDGRRIPALTWRYTDFAGRGYRVHEAHACGLAPDTTYDYIVHSGGASSQALSFRTAPDDPADEVVILALGDSRGNPAVYGALVAKADELAAPDLLLYTGDAITATTNQDAWDAFLAAGGAALTRMPTLAALGNHEEGNGAFFSLWALPDNERWFELDYGAAHVMVLDDSTRLLPDIDGGGERFLRERLPEVPDGQWKLVVHHKPIYSAPGNHGSTKRLQERWAPLYDEHGVDLVINGHDHKYERTHPMRAGARDDADGTVYLVSGGAGAPLYSANTADWTAKAVADYHFLLLKVRPTSLEVTAYDAMGTVLDELTLAK